jgi:transcription-repair coupling factor (superfamily II helicase)
VIGTHALLSKQVQFKRLGLVIVDEDSASAWATRKSSRS